MPLTGDGYFAGEYPGGTTTVEGAPVSAAVLVYQRDSGQLIAQTESSQSGEWIVTGVDLSKAHDIVGRKEGFNDVIVSNVMPTSMVVITYTDKILPNETFTGALGYLELVGGIPPYAASVVDPLPAGIFPVVNGRQLIIDGTTTDDDVFNSTVRITSSNGATKDVPVKLVVGFKAPANLEAETLEDAGTFSVVLTWGVTNSTQEVLVFKSATPFDLGSMPPPIATLSGDAVSYTDDDVIEDDVFYYMTASVCEGFTLYSDEVEEVVITGDPHWDNVVSLLHFDSDLSDETGRVWESVGSSVVSSDESVFGGSSLKVPNTAGLVKTPHSADFEFGSGDFTIEFFLRPTSYAQWSTYIDKRASGDFFAPFVIQRDGNSNNMRISSAYAPGSWPVVISVSHPPLNVWSHIAYVRWSGVFIAFINGVQVGAVDGGSNSLLTNTATLNIAAAGNNTYGMNGYIDELRITKGVARYTGNFTPPTEPFLNF